ncbi:conserved hypothetical protein [Maribacter litoralis]|uniref:Uncharacterized protein n=1 Tax=Maribacter litoralis TaxID=2059726 RepID=A0A653S1E2_9FLAO|nr:conserved hypothetical protein [Maribacter litoralis]
MYRYSMFGFEGNWKYFPQMAYKIGCRLVKQTSALYSSIMQSQHDYFFIPTTQRQILV